MKKLFWLVICFFCLLNPARAATLNCPKVASPGEVINCSIEEKDYIGLSLKYQIESGLSYYKFQLDSNLKKYYAGPLGFNVGNVFDNKEDLKLNFQVKVGMDVSLGRNYFVKLVDIEGVTSDYNYVVLDDLTSDIKIVSDVNTLSSLEISSGKLSPSFNKNIMSYGATVDSDKVVIKAVASDGSAKVLGDIGEKELNYGVNSFIIRVISARGNERKYYLYITRTLKEVKKSSDATLKSLSTSCGEIDLKKDKFLYELDVDYSVEDISVKAIANSNKASVEIKKPDKLVIGNNIVEIVVTAEDGTIGKYMINVQRRDKLSSDATIKNLIVKDYELSFESNIYNYDLLIWNEDKLDIEVELNSDKAKYTIKGNNNLKNHSKIYIEVIAEDGTEKTYKLNIEKLNEENSSSVVNSVKFIPLICFIVLVSIVLIVKVLINKFVKKEK